MLSHRFLKFPDGTLKKVFTIVNDETHIYRISVKQSEWCESVRKKDCPDFASLSGLVDPLVVECSWEVEWGRRRLLWWKGVFERFKCSQT